MKRFWIRFLSPLWFYLMAFPFFHWQTFYGQEPFIWHRGWYIPLFVLVFLAFEELWKRKRWQWTPRVPLVVPHRWVLLSGLLFLAVFPLFASDLWLEIASRIGIYMMLALGLNICVGLAGLLDLGFIASFAVGAYTWGFWATGVNNVFPYQASGWHFWLSIPIAALNAAIFRFLIGYPSLRLRGDYLAIATLGYGIITERLLDNLVRFTGGPNGLFIEVKPSLFGFVLDTDLEICYLVFALLVLSIWFTERLAKSRIGRAWVAIREDEQAAEAMGIPVFRYRLLAYVLGALWAGAAGAAYAAKMSYLHPSVFKLDESIYVLAMVVLGGMGSTPGVLLGAFLLVTIPELLREIGDYRMLLFGLLLAVIMIFRPQGLVMAKRISSPVVRYAR